MRPTTRPSTISHMPPPVLSLVVLNWDQLDRSERCIRSLRNNTDVPYQLILVDNGSAPGIATRLEALADSAVLHDRNLGFARGMNSGLAAATGKYVAFINNDTEFPNPWASMLIDTFSAVDDCGIVLPAVTAAGNSASVRDRPGDGVKIFTPFTAIPSGVVYVVDRLVAAALGGFCEEYPVASAEDLDLLFTYWANGRQVALDERVLVDHESAVTVAEKLPDRDERYRTNRLIFTKRWMDAAPDTIPRLPDYPLEAFQSNLEKARVAATWMDHWFRTQDRATAAERQLVRLKAATEAKTASKRAWLSVARRLVPAPVRRLRRRLLRN
jgi:GT2 family glycosyltransferase